MQWSGLILFGLSAALLITTPGEASAGLVMPAPNLTALTLLSSDRTVDDDVGDDVDDSADDEERSAENTGGEEPDTSDETEESQEC